MKPYKRLLFMVVVATFHTVSYYLVNHINSSRPPDIFYNLQISIDQCIPYLGWTWTIYYLGHLYIIFWAGFVLWSLPREPFLRAIYIYIGMIVVESGIQVLIPAQTPWPENMCAMQGLLHKILHDAPFACLPSCHVTLTVLPAYISLYTLRSGFLKALSITLAVLITVSTLTLKEHYILDAASGILLALIAGYLWRGRGNSKK